MQANFCPLFLLARIKLKLYLSKTCRQREGGESKIQFEAFFLSALGQCATSRSVRFTPRDRSAVPTDLEARWATEPGTLLPPLAGLNDHLPA